MENKNNVMELEKNYKLLSFCKNETRILCNGYWCKEKRKKTIPRTIFCVLHLKDNFKEFLCPKCFVSFFYIEINDNHISIVGKERIKFTRYLKKETISAMCEKWNLAFRVPTKTDYGIITTELNFKNLNEKNTIVWERCQNEYCHKVIYKKCKNITISSKLLHIVKQFNFWSLHIFKKGMIDIVCCEFHCKELEKKNK